MSKYGLVLLSCYYGSVFCLCQIRVLALPHVHTASCQILAGQEVSLMLPEMTKVRLTCG